MGSSRPQLFYRGAIPWSRRLWTSNIIPWTQLSVRHVSQARPVKPVRHVHVPLPNTPSSHTPCPEQLLPASPGQSEPTDTGVNKNEFLLQNITYLLLIAIYREATSTPVPRCYNFIKFGPDFQSTFTDTLSI